MLWLIVLVLLVLWLLGGPIFSFGGDLIHVLLLVVVILVIFNLVGPRLRGGGDV